MIKISVVKGNFHMCSILCYSQGTQMPPSIAFFSITVCNTISILHTCIYILSFSVISWKKICGSSPLKRSTASKQIYLLMNHLPYYPDINYVFLQCPLHSRQSGAEQWTIARLSVFLFFMFLFKSFTLLLSCSGLLWLPGLDWNLPGKLFTGNE